MAMADYWWQYADATNCSQLHINFRAKRAIHLLVKAALHQDQQWSL